jgi:transposase
MEQHIVYVGLDVHQDTIAAAFAEAGKRGELRWHGKVLY